MVVGGMTAGGKIKNEGAGEKIMKKGEEKKNCIKNGENAWKSVKNRKKYKKINMIWWIWLYLDMFPGVRIWTQTKCPTVYR